MASPFVSVTCAVRYDNARVLIWSLKPGANYPADFIFRVENSRAGGPWETISEDITDSCAFIDTRKRNYNKKLNEYYRVRLTAESTGEDWVSEPCEAGQTKAFPFSASAENVIRQAEQAIKISGCTGVILKKKVWGSRCLECTDFKGESTVNEHCTSCFGTGIAGGYYNGISTSLIKDNITTDEDTSAMGYVQGETVQGRCVAYPWIHPGDVWVEDHTNNRYIIVKATPGASFKHVTLIYSLLMHRLEMTDVLYTPPADSKAYVKDLWDSALIDYTPESLASQEVDDITAWDRELEKL